MKNNIYHHIISYHWCTHVAWNLFQCWFLFATKTISWYRLISAYVLIFDFIFLSLHHVIWCGWQLSGVGTLLFGSLSCIFLPNNSSAGEILAVEYSVALYDRRKFSNAFFPLRPSALAVWIAFLRERLNCSTSPLGCGWYGATLWCLILISAILYGA